MVIQHFDKLKNFILKPVRCQWSPLKRCGKMGSLSGEKSKGRNPARLRGAGPSSGVLETQSGNCALGGTEVEQGI